MGVFAVEVRGLGPGTGGSSGNSQHSGRWRMVGVLAREFFSSHKTPGRDVLLTLDPTTAGERGPAGVGHLFGVAALSPVSWSSVAREERIWGVSVLCYTGRAREDRVGKDEVQSPNRQQTGLGEQISEMR